MSKRKGIQLACYYQKDYEDDIGIVIKGRKLRSRLTQMLRHSDVVGFWTFTFYDDIPNSERSRIWNRFISRLRKAFPGMKIRYIRVKEYTQRGRIHYHVIFNVFLPWNIVQGIWQSTGAGVVVDVKVLKNPISAASYIAKYLIKSIYALDGDSRGIVTCSYVFCLHLSNFPKWLNKALRMRAFDYLNAVIKAFDFHSYLYEMHLSRRKWCTMMRFIQSWYELTGDYLATHQSL